MNFKFTSYIILLNLLFSTMSLKAQNIFQDFEKEKTYIQTNHVFYKPGEEMYFKIYVVQGKNNLPAEDSKVVNFEMVDPSGSVLKKSKYEIKNGYAEGYFSFADDMKGGIYKIRAYTNWMLNEEGKNDFEKEITLQKIVSPRILMKLDFPKKGYGPGDEVTADFSMRSLSNLPIPFYEADYVVTHNGETVTEGKLTTDKEGKKLLQFRLPKVLKSSDALLNIKVNFDGFTESVSRNIPIVLNHLDVKFLPEGGTFINGAEQNVAFKILDEFEKPVDAVLNIYNQKHEKIAEASSYNFGMGSFLFTPKTGETYYAKVIRPENITQVYPLPVPKNDGLMLNITKQNEMLSFKTTSTQEKNIVLKGFFRGKEVYSKEITLKNGINLLELPEKDFPAGICRFTILENNIPLAERIVFTNKNQQMNIKVKPVKEYYQPREKVVLNIETTDRNNKPVPANLAVSVVDDKLWTYADDKQNHIISWLLMDSELKGKIEKPQFYFDKKEEKADKSLDLVMLTNGYRYFEPIPEIIKTGKYKYLPEKKGTVYGIVEDENKKPVKADVFLVEINNMQIIKQTTTENGKFYFSGMAYGDSYKVIAKSLTPKHKVKIRILSYKLEISPLVEQKLKNIDVEEIIKEAEIKEEQKKKVSETPTVMSKGYIPSDTISNKHIEEVVIVAYGTEINKKTLTASVSITANSEIKDSNYGSLLQGKVAGVTVTPAGNQQKENIVIRGASSIQNKTPLFVVDGVPVENFNTTVNPNDINSVTVLKDAAATAIYGSRAANGVVIINSNAGISTQNKFDITPQTYFAVMTIPWDALTNYSDGKHFAYPEYKTTNTSYRFDYREALYWNPVVETDQNGKAKIEFYNSDANSTFRAITEGISAFGLIGRDETTYAAQSLISIDAKIPQYLTRADEMLIPVVIKNNSRETRTMTMDVIVPNHVKLVSSDSLITLKPLESGRLYAKIQTDEVVNSNIQFIIRSGEFRETMILPFKVEEKGFLRQFSVIDNNTKEINLDIPEYINGSLFSSYNLFENTALKMFNDLERLKKEPHGCFEQLSSTVYPNIFILDYLKSISKIDSSTESLVIRNLKKGFQKMMSYKNKDGGVGYFNSTESDVSLSAFALLEFTDLRKHIVVDPKLIQGLSSFILSKKGKNGLFEVRKFYESKSAVYSEYYWSRNMYVLYALSQLGFKTEIEDTYQVLLSRALVKKDSYQLALLANASANLGKSKEYDTLIFILNKQFEDQKLKSETTFTGSWGISADAEALSLYIMALQKDEKLNQQAIVKVADMLMSYNGVYGFGSTQATTLALQALSQVFIKNEKIYSSDAPVVKINNVVVSPNINVSSAYKTGNNKINITYPSQAGLFYNLEYQYYTLQAPESADIPVMLETKLKSENSRVGETSRMTVTVKNKVNNQLPMTVAKIGIPAGLTLQTALLKDLTDKKQISYYEIFDNYLVLYWEHFGAEETKTINLDLKVEFAGTYTGKSSNVYLYYMPESKYWNQGVKTTIEP